ncbi:L-threonine aldolase [Caminicella sporogenes DSM 14501]|uniref:L-threonine aldolase n=1 Tax=Caminicella sporogenes DSM 14501 TaxID=1121266 RepID=A0A1M6MH84_9FIRM|nr:low-specificity L-threonine aldolase [Caminicella sporogenes]RKD27551.1 threonine aldolase [Caminicella sporogenes]SHJ82808.1 L-threonine aldolase [Caminicella sporogenes DSM 14501]
MKKMIDLRSDTVTMPTDEMRQAMASAPVGDDGYGDDPTVKKLEEKAADIVGKEDALFVPSGIFGNQLAILTHTNRGDEIIVEANSHIVMHEVGAAAVIAGVQLRNIEGRNGRMSIKDVERAIREENIHFPRTGLICIENAHSCGTVIGLDNMSEISEIAKKNNIPVHLDGARVFNAAKALNVDVKEITKYADSVMFCLSKGLCAPVGSILAGSKEFIEKARKNRKLMGGGLRQAGIIAAAGIVALDTMIDRLEEDHKNAKYLAEKLSEIDKIEVRFDKNDINMVFFKISDDIIEEKNFINKLLEKNIKINGKENGEYRFVTNNDVSRDDIDYVVQQIKNILD